MLIRTCVAVLVVVAACKASGNHPGAEDAGEEGEPPVDAAADAPAVADAPPDAPETGDAGSPGCARVGYPSVAWPATGPAPRSILAIDVSGDGVLDLVVGGDESIDILIGHGDGSFEPRQPYPATSSSVAVADVTRDGVVDLVMPDAAASALRILPGLGGGRFGAAIAIPVSAGPGLVAARDFNGDGALDILVSHGGHSLGVLLGGGAMLGPEITSPMTFSPGKLVVADFNGDGTPDVAMVGSPQFVTTLLFGRGDGTFQPEVAMAGGSPGFDTGDVNGDGAPDLLYSNVFFSSVSVAVNNGDGTFRDGGVFLTVEDDANLSMGSTSAAVADVTGDGVGDLLVATADFGGLVVLPGTGDGSFQGAVNFASIPIAADSGEMAIADLNGDGLPDAMIVSDNREVSVLLGAAGGGFQRSRIFSQAIELAPVLVDLDGDGVLDFIEPGRPRVGLGNGDGTFREVASYGVAGEMVAVADLDGDGVLDLAVVTSANVQVLRGHGDGAFDPAVVYPAGRGDLAVLAITDLDGDGALDIVAADTAGRVVTALRGRGDGAFDPASEVPIDVPLATAPTALTAVDLDGDHRVDLVLTSAGSSRVTILRGNGDGTFANLGDYATGERPTAAVVVDVDGDHVPDVVVASQSEFAIRVWLGNGNATFSPGDDVVTEGVASSLVAADMNGDGVFDLVTTSVRGNSAGFRLGRGDGTFAPIEQYGADPFATNVIVGDLDGDGRPDMIVTGGFFHGTTVMLATCL